MQRPGQVAFCLVPGGHAEARHRERERERVDFHVSSPFDFILACLELQNH